MNVGISVGPDTLIAGEDKADWSGGENCGLLAGMERTQDLPIRVEILEGSIDIPACTQRQGQIGLHLPLVLAV